MTLPLRLCDSVAPLVLILCTSVRKTNLFGYISRLQNNFVLFNISLIRGVMIKTFEISVLRAFYFSLTWRLKDVPKVMETKFSKTVMVSGVVSNEGDVMPPHIFEVG